MNVRTASIASLGALLAALALWILLPLKSAGTSEPAESDAAPGTAKTGGQPAIASSTKVHHADVASTPRPTLSRETSIHPTDQQFAERPATPWTSLSAREFKKELLEELRAAEPVWQDCMESLQVNGDASGVVVVRFIISNPERDASKATHARVELSEVAHEGTTLQVDALHECLAESAHQMQFTLLPETMSGIATGFEIRIESGVIAGSGAREFSFLRDTDPILSTN